MQEKLQFNFAERWQLKLAKPAEEQKKRNKLMAVGVAGVLFVGGLGIIPWVWEYTLNQDIAKVNNQIQTMKQVDIQVKQLKNLKARVNNQKQLITLMKQSTNDPEPILNKIRALLPTGSLVNSFVLTAEKTINISITVKGPVEVTRLWVNFRDSGMFKNVDMQTVSLQDKAQSVNFILNLK
jgi:Tfp pilus assembly protein PilN